MNTTIEMKEDGSLVPHKPTVPGSGYVGTKRRLWTACKTFD